MIGNYKEEYAQKLMSADKLAAQIPDGSVILTDVLTSEPFEIFKALDRRCEADNIRDCKLFTAIDLYPYKFITDKKYQKNILLVSMFSSGLTRNAVQSGVADFKDQTASQPGRSGHDTEKRSGYGRN